MKKLLLYNGRNIIAHIPKSELIANAGRTFRPPYSNKNGKDIDSLKVEVVNCKGCQYSTNPFLLVYDWNKNEAVVLIDWESIITMDSQASFEIRLTGNYNFEKKVCFHVIKIESYFSFFPQNNLIGRGKLQIGTFRIINVCDDNDVNDFEPNQHRIEIDNEVENNRNALIKIDEANHMAESEVLDIPFNKSRSVKVFMDFGENGIDKPFNYTFSIMLNGEQVTFKTKAITINPYIPQLKHRIELNKNDDGVAKLDLQDGTKEIGYLYVCSDAINGEQSIDYSLKTDSKILTLGDETHGKENTISPLESEHQFPLVFNGTELPHLPEKTIDVKIKNGNEEIDSIHFVRKSSEANLDNSILLTAPSFSKINNGESFSKIVYFGNNYQIELPFEIIKDVANVSLCIKPNDIDFANIFPPTHCSKLTKGKMSIKVRLTPELAIGKKEFTVYASAPYHKDAKCEITIDCKEKITPKIKFTFDPYKKVINDKILVYTDSPSEKIGKLTLQCGAGNGVQNPRKEHYKEVNLKSDLIILQDNYSIIQLIQQGEEADQKEVLLLGESVSYDVIVEPSKAKGSGEFELSFKCLNDQAKNIPKIVIKDKKPEDIPVFSFQSESEIVYPVNQDRIMVGALSVTIQEKQNGRYNRENGVVFFKEGSHFYFSNKKEEKNSSCLKLSEIKEPVPVYFDAYNFFECAENIEQDKTVQLPLEYKDDNVDKEPVSVNMEKGIFVVKPYPAAPILEIVFIDAKENTKTVLFDDSLKAEVEASEGIQYTQAMLNLPPGRKFKLKLKNSQKISLPRKCIRISELKADKDFILIDAKDEYCIYNGENEEVVGIKIDWRKVQGGCSSFAISGKIDGKAFVINVKCQIYEKIATNWRSLDLGTSAIVLAKMHRDNINTIIDTVKLADSEMSLESHEDMISSIIALYKSDDSDCHELVLSPERKKYNQATAILPPLKFLVGQTSLPFTDSFQRKGIRKLKSQFLEEVVLDENLSPDTILESIYKDVFSRIDEIEQEEIKKLILTYPSTYTKEQIANLKNLVLKQFPNIQEQNLDFVAESDAVLAQYLYTKRTTVGGTPLKDDEKILIYDMGAGTLDISYVRIKVENQGEKNQVTKAIIEKRIGIPVAGNYLDYCIFEYLKSHLADEALEDPKSLKKNIQELKIKISGKSGEDDLASESLTGFALKEQSEISYQSIIESENVQSFFRACSDDVFKLLLGDQWNNERVTFVYSGRGCLFKPLIDHIKKISGWDPQPISSSSKEMKLCAAKGAIRYSQMFSKDCQQPFEIKSFKYYESFGLVYRTYDDRNTETFMCKILKSADDFRELEKENLHSTIRGIDIRPNGPIILVQSYLPPNRISQSFNNKDKKEEDMDGCYISEIFRVYREELGLEDTVLQDAWVDFSIDDFNDTIMFTIANQPLNDHKRTVSIENDDFYKKSMWPFNN